MNLVQVYEDPSDLIPLLETKDYLGQNMLSILSESDMYHVLDTKIMDRIIKEKWNGIQVETFSII